MHEPDFWHRYNAAASRLLRPASLLYGALAARRMTRTGADVGIPVLCVGNYHMGGAGKTPTVLALVRVLRELREQPVVVSRGYGGRLRGPVPVHALRHSAADVGDEPMMMAASVPVIVSRDRVAGAAMACENGASLVVLDDGFQNPALRKHASLIVIDSMRGIGNGEVFPAGPLRAPLAMQLERTDALVVVGDGHAADQIAGWMAARNRPVFRARFQPDRSALNNLRRRRVLAFAGIGDPSRFFETLRSSGVEVADARSFPDHYPFTARDIEGLMDAAKRQGLTLVTTEKDMARLRTDPRLPVGSGDIASFGVALRFDNEKAFGSFVAQRLEAARKTMS